MTTNNETIMMWFRNDCEMTDLEPFIDGGVEAMHVSVAEAEELTGLKLNDHGRNIPSQQTIFLKELTKIWKYY